MQNILDKIYVDMDGVTTNFDEQFKTINGAYPANSNRNDHYKNFSKFVNDEGFKNAPLMPNAKALISGLVDIANRHNIQIQFLTSDGSMREFRNKVMLQKKLWLQKHGIWLGDNNFILSHGWRGKSDYANSRSLLIDDTERNTIHFTENGGNAFLYRDSECFKMLKALDDVLSA